MVWWICTCVPYPANGNTRNVSSSTQNQAFNALLFLCRHVLHVDLQDMEKTLRARRGRRLPVVLTQEEVASVLDAADGLAGLMLRLIYGCGLRVMECVRLRVKDLDFASELLYVRSGKGDKDRTPIILAATTRELTGVSGSPSVFGDFAKHSPPALRANV